MHQPFAEKNKKFTIGELVMLDNGIPEFEDMCGIGIVVAIYPLAGLERNEVLVYWSQDIWLNGRNQVMSSYELREVKV
jgi:hypothetical protein